MQKLLAHFFKIVGPAAVMAAGTMGAGSTASLILAGAWFRYELLWVAVFILPLFIIAVDSASRIGMVNRERGMFTLIRENIHPGVAWLIFAINIPVHLFIAMSHMSVMTSAFLALFNFYPAASTTASGMDSYHIAEIILSLLFAATIVWLLAAQGYQRMQKFMTAFMILMFVCFLVVALRGFQEISAILSGFVPSVPADLNDAALNIHRGSWISIIAIVGSVLSPAALFGMSYLSADNQQGEPDFKSEFRRSFINLGIIYGGYSLFVIIAGGFALYPLANHAEIDSVHEASKILLRAFPDALSFLGPFIFTAGIFMAALTTFVVVVEVISYFCLDMFRHNWHYTADNKRFKRMISICIVAPALLAPFWSFPALLKNLLLMGVNAIVIPFGFLTLLILINKKTVMGEHTASPARNAVLAFGLLLSISLSIYKLPDFIRIFST